MFNASLPAPVSCFECEDDLYQDCQRRSLRGLCEGRGLTGEEKMKTVLYMLSFCRRSCRVIFSPKHFLTGLKKKYQTGFLPMLFTYLKTSKQFGLSFKDNKSICSKFFYSIPPLRRLICLVCPFT